MNSIEFENIYKNNINLIENELKKCLQGIKEQTPELILNAMEYSLLAGGKRIRPVLLIEWGRLMGINEDETLNFATALEMIHTYSLIHDDLPCMDNDDLRRGKKTSHKMFGEAIALLAGDGLLNLAYETIFKSEHKNALKAGYEIALAAGACGMIGGQTIDITSEQKELKREELDKMHLKKTGELIKAATLCATILANKGEKEKEDAKNYAALIGLAFQIQDDILDVSGTTKELGKSINSDTKLKKSTYVKAIGIENCKKEVKLLTEKAIEILKGYKNSEFLINLTNKLANRNN